MPEKRTLRAARRDLRRGDAPSTAAGEFVREEMHHIREGKHGARSTEQAIAIGLSKARRAGIPLGGGKRGAGAKKRSSAKPTHRAPSKKRGRAVERALEREPHAAASSKALSKHGKRAASKRTHAQRSAAARKAARTRARHEHR